MFLSSYPTRKPALLQIGTHQIPLLSRKPLSLPHRTGSAIMRHGNV